MAAVLEFLRQAGLTAKPNKCAVVQYLGYHLGSEEVRSQMEKTGTIASCLCPKTKKGGDAVPRTGWLWFVPSFVELTSPLTNFTWKGAPDLVQQTEQSQAVFV